MNPQLSALEKALATVFTVEGFETTDLRTPGFMGCLFSFSRQSEPAEGAATGRRLSMLVDV